MPFRILILSDIHMYDGAPSASGPSWVSSHAVHQNPRKNPLTGLPTLFDDTPKIDWILCPGDLADKNNPTCQNLAWTRLEELRKKLHARHLFATVGNHDVDSRHVNERNDLPTDALRALTPAFPHINATNDSLRNEYWSYGITQHTEDDESASLIILNSCDFHGLDSGVIEDGKLKEQEWNRGKISNAAIDRLNDLVKKTKTRRNIILVHHHLDGTLAPERDYSVISNGHKILEAVDRSDHDWLVVHGHLHYPRLYQSVNLRTTSVLSSGALGGMTYKLKSGTSPDNQVHLIEYTDDKVAKAVIHSWNWVHEEGWQPASSFKHGLPTKTGFGSTTTVESLHRSIRAILDKTPEMAWADVVSAVPDVDFLTPDQHQRLCTELEQSGEIELLLSRRNPTMVNRIRRT